MKETEQEHKRKRSVWIGSSLEDLKDFPPEVQDEMGYALNVAEVGDKHPKATPLKGFSGVMEIRSVYKTNTYRTLKFGQYCYIQVALSQGVSSSC